MNWKKRVDAAYTVEAAGVMAAVLITIVILLNGAFYIREKTVGAMRLHTTVEQERHALSARKESEISRQTVGAGWELTITVPVFRPEESLRQWSLVEERP